MFAIIWSYVGLSPKYLIISWAAKRLRNYCIEAVCVCLSVRDDLKVA